MSTTIPFRIFLVCLAICASMVLVGIWLGDEVLPEAYFKTAASVFIVGLANFLVWFSCTLRAIYALLLERR